MKAHFKVMAMFILKFFADRKTDRKTDRQTNRWGKNSMPSIYQYWDLKITLSIYRTSCFNEIWSYCERMAAQETPNRQTGWYTWWQTDKLTDIQDQYLGITNLWCEVPHKMHVGTQRLFTDLNKVILSTFFFSRLISVIIACFALLFPSFWFSDLLFELFCLLFQFFTIWKILQNNICTKKTRTRGPWWPWIAHLSHFPHYMNSTFVVTNVPTCDPLVGASSDSRGIIWIKLTKVHKEMLYIKYESSAPSSFRKEEFWSLPSLFLCSFFVPKLVTPGAGPVWPLGYHMYKLGWGP